MKFEVMHSLWGADGDEYAGGTHEVAKPSRKLLGLLAAAEAAGVVKVSASKDERATMAKALEPDADSLKAQARAMESGEWHAANIRQFDHDVMAGTRTPDLGGDS